MSNPPLVSVIVVNYNGKKYIRECLNSLLDQKYPNFEIIVVDNASTDNSPEIIKKEFPQIKLIINNKNLGFAAGNNVGIKKAEGELIALFNPDAIAEPNWLSELVNAFNSSLDVGIAGGIVYYYEPKDVVWAAGGKIDIFTGVSWHIYQGEKINSKNLKTTDDIDYIPGCALVIRKNLLEKINLLDEEYFLYTDDLDLGFQIKRLGYRCLFVPTAVVYHAVSYSWKGKSLFGYSHHVRSRLYFYFKHFPIPFLITSLFFYTLISTFFELLLFRRPLSYFTIKIKVLMNILKNIHKIVEKRRELKKNGNFRGKIRIFEVLKITWQRIKTRKYYW